MHLQRMICSLSILLALFLAGSAVAAKPATGTHPVLMKAGDQSKIAPVPRDEVICFALYTTHKGVLKLSAQLYPLAKEEPHTVSLEIERDGTWKKIAEAPVHPVGWTATFRVEDWDQARDAKYRVRHASGSVYEGLIRKDPVDRDAVAAAVFTGNSPGPGGGKISKRDVVENVRKADPDILLFTGDQVYTGSAHTEHWLKFGELFGDMMRDRPTVTIPDDHDVGQGNLWGAGGGKVSNQNDGGYTHSAAYVKMVERQQTSHLPDPVDPTPIKQGIGVYFTQLNVGGVDFAILEDRKFKSGCTAMKVKQRQLGSREDLLTKPGVDPKQFDQDGLTLLGDRQLKFLREWSEDWSGTEMKAVVSQTIFSMAMTHGAGKRRFVMDFDTNGWPQQGRNRAVALLRRGFAVHLCGDQHLSTIGQYGLDTFGDAGWWFCVPSIANLYPRYWAPGVPPVRKIEGPRECLGDYLDGFGNKLTIYAHTSPRKTGRQPAALHDRMPGWGLVTFDKANRTITMACWPRMTDPADPTSRQYPGWPRTVTQLDQFNPPGWGKLPTVQFEQDDPVVQLRDAKSGEVIYTLRINGRTFTPHAPADRDVDLYAGANGPEKKVVTKGRAVVSP